MTLHSEWRRLLRHAWSIRLLALAGLFQALQAVLPAFEDVIPGHWFGIASGLATTGAFIARLITQKEFHNDQDE
jgi:hypothetical protein